MSSLTVKDYQRRRRIVTKKRVPLVLSVDVAEVWPTVAKAAETNWDYVGTRATPAGAIKVTSSVPIGVFVPVVEVRQVTKPSVTPVTKVAMSTSSVKPRMHSTPKDRVMFRVLSAVEREQGIARLEQERRNQGLPLTVLETLEQQVRDELRKEEKKQQEEVDLECHEPVSQEYNQGYWTQDEEEEWALVNEQ